MSTLSIGMLEPILRDIRVERYANLSATVLLAYDLGASRARNADVFLHY